MEEEEQEELFSELMKSLCLYAGLALSNWNDGFRILDPCSWFGLDCWNTNVLVL